MSEIPYLTSPGVDLRLLFRLLLLSFAIVLVALYGFRRNAAAKRAFLLLTSSALIIAPVLLIAFPLRLAVGIEELPAFNLRLPLAHSVQLGLLCLWFVPALLRVSRTLVENHRARSHYLSLPDLNQPAVQSMANSIATKLGCRHLPQLKQGAQCCCLTIPQPVIVLPRSLLQPAPNAAALRAVLAHELVHGQRRDDRALLLLQLLQDWYWWMPWLTLVARQFEQAVEESCDDRAADLFAPGHTYLSGVVAACKATATEAVAGASAASMTSQPLLLRVIRFAQQRDYDADWPAVAGATGLLLCLVLLTTSVELVPATHSRQSAEPMRVTVVSPGSYAPTLSNRHRVVARTPIASQPALLTAIKDHRHCQELAPIYPGPALLAGREADVVVRYKIGRDGRVFGARIVSGTPEFHHTVLRAIRANRYPARHQVQRLYPSDWIDPHETGPPLEVQQRFQFRLEHSI